MIYEGSYLDEKENGNGKSYYLNNGKLRYVGEFLLGQFHGEGKEYDANGNLIFEGEYLHGKHWTGKIFNTFNKNIYELKERSGYDMKYNRFDGLLKYEGEYLKGIKNGKGKKYQNGNLIFEGEFLNGEKIGQEKNYNGEKTTIFVNEYLNKKRKGEEYDKDGNLLFIGEYIYNHRLKGKEFYKGKLVYEGEYLEGIKNGKGKVYNIDGKLKYEGEFVNGKKSGKGKEYDKNGNLLFEGEFFEGKKWSEF